MPSLLLFFKTYVPLQQNYALGKQIKINLISVILGVHNTDTFILFFLLEIFNILPWSVFVNNIILIINCCSRAINPRPGGLLLCSLLNLDLASINLARVWLSHSSCPKQSVSPKITMPNKKYPLQIIQIKNFHNHSCQNTETGIAINLKISCSTPICGKKTNPIEE
jgi:hypothetical protein